MIGSTVSQTASDKLSLEKAFIDVIRKLDKGKLAQLRRNAGNSISESRGIYWIYSMLGSFNVKAYNEDLYLLIASLMAMDKNALSENPRLFNGSFGKTVLQAKNASNSDGIDRRFGILLDVQFDASGNSELAFRLRQMIKLVLSKDASIDWPQLLYDLSRWDSPDKWIQKKWARDFYSPDLPESQVPELTSNDQIIKTNKGEN